MTPSNQSMKPTTSDQVIVINLATDPARGLSLSRTQRKSPY